MTAVEIHTPNAAELDAYMRQAEMLATSNLVPQSYRGKAADILVAALTGRELGMGPIAALQYVIVINGKPTLNAEGRVGLIRKHGHSIVGSSTPTVATVTGKRRDTGDEMTVEWTLDMAKRANLVKAGPWVQYPEAMLWARAVSQLSRMLFADVLMGCSYDPEELGAEVDADGHVLSGPPVLALEVVREVPEGWESLESWDDAKATYTDAAGALNDEQRDNFKRAKSEQGIGWPPSPAEMTELLTLLDEYVVRPESETAELEPPF